MGSPDPARLQDSVSQALKTAEVNRMDVYPDKDALATAVSAAVAEGLEAAVSQRGVAHLSLTGGSMGSKVVQALARDHAHASWWSSVHVWWGDERYVPRGHPDRNDQQADDAGLGSLPVPDEAVHRLVGAREGTEDGDLAGLPTAALEYAAQLAALAPATTDPGEVPAPVFDVMLLGLGPDTHVASLFPGREEVLVTDPATPTVAVTESPKPPPLRVSLTVPALRRSRSVHFVVAGADKAEAVRRAREAQPEDPAVPASFVRGQLDTVWWLDAEAAGE
jgi:6-phosphogluconolactonase